MRRRTDESRTLSNRKAPRLSVILSSVSPGVISSTDAPTSGPLPAESATTPSSERTGGRPCRSACAHKAARAHSIRYRNIVGLR